MAAYTTIDDPELYFQTVLWTGNGSDDHAITFDGSENMSPNLIWQKNRTDAVSHGVFDTVRGIGGGSNTYRLLTDSTNAEDDASNTVKSADSDGFTLGTNANLNGSSDANVAWCWKESATAGFDIVSYTGNGTNRTISHSLSAVPHMMIIKNRATTADWLVYHKAEGHSHYLLLSETNGFGTESGVAKEWNSTDPTSSVFSVGTSAATNGNTNATIAYLFTSIQGFSKFGTYEGNNNSDGPMIYTGFKPAMVLFKRSSSTENWSLYDNKRKGYNPQSFGLRPNTNLAESEYGTTDTVDFLANGFKIRESGTNINNGTYVYCAWAESPLVNSNGVPCNAR